MARAKFFVMTVNPKDQDASVKINMYIGKRPIHVTENILLVPASQVSSLSRELMGWVSVQRIHALR